MNARSRSTSYINTVHYVLRSVRELSPTQLVYKPFIAHALTDSSHLSSLSPLSPLSSHLSLLISLLSSLSCLPSSLSSLFFLPSSLFFLLFSLLFSSLFSCFSLILLSSSSSSPLVSRFYVFSFHPFPSLPSLSSLTHSFFHAYFTILYEIITIVTKSAASPSTTYAKMAVVETKIWIVSETLPKGECTWIFSKLEMALSVQDARFFDPLHQNRRSLSPVQPFVVKGNKTAISGDIIFIVGRLNKDRSIIKTGCARMLSFYSISSLHMDEVSATEAACVLPEQIIENGVVLRGMGDILRAGLDVVKLVL